MTTIADRDQGHKEAPFLRHRHGRQQHTAEKKLDPRTQSPCPTPKTVAAPTVLNTIQSWEQYCVLSIKVDTPHGVTIPDQVDAALLNLLQAEEIEDRAVGCRWAEGLYLCAIMNADIAAAETYARQLQDQLARSRPETVTIGIAAFPQLTFSRGQSLINTCKALDHAAFFGPGSIVSFDATSLNISGDKLYHAGELDMAAAEYRIGLEMNPCDANLYNSLGICQAQKGDLAGAAKTFRTAIEIEPGETMAIYNLGMVALLEKDPEKALVRFQDAYALDQSTYEIPFQIGKLLFDRRDWKSALDYLQKAVELNDLHWRLFNLMGACLAKLGSTTKAIQAYGRAVKINPNDADGLSALGCLYDECGENPELCEAFFQQSIRLKPENGLYYHRLGLWHQKHNRADLAKKAYLQASALGRDASQEIDALESMNHETGDPTVRCA